MNRITSIILFIFISNTTDVQTSVFNRLFLNVHSALPRITDVFFEKTTHGCPEEICKTSGEQLLWRHKLIFNLEILTGDFEDALNELKTGRHLAKMQSQEPLQLSWNSFILIISVLATCSLPLLLVRIKKNRELYQRNLKVLEDENDYLKQQYETVLKNYMSISIRLEKKQTLLKHFSENSRINAGSNFQKILKEDEISDNYLKELEYINQNIHSEFSIKLQEVSKQKLTKLDYRYAAYIYLDMDNQQIADNLNVSINTVRVTKFRLKTKLGLAKNDDLTTYIKNFKA